MKALSKLIFVLLLSLPLAAQAQTVANDLVGQCAFDGNCADYIAGIIPGGSVLDNNTYLKARNQADSADINVLKVDASDNTVLNSSASDDLIFQLEDDAQRIITLDASADTLMQIRFGDGGTTAAQNLDILGSTSDGDDDQRLCLAAADTCADNTRSAYLFLEGEQDAGAGDATLEALDDLLLYGGDDIFLIMQSGGDDIVLDTATNTADDITLSSGDDIVLQGDGAGDIVTIAGGGTSVDVTVADNMVTLASGTELTLGGDIISTQTNIGAVVATGANTACNTTCAVANGACIFGWDTSGTQSTNVACDGATADECLCLPAS